MTGYHHRAKAFAVCLAAVLLLSCEQDGPLGPDNESQTVAIAPRILLARADSMVFFERTRLVQATLHVEGRAPESVTVPFDSGHHTFRKLPAKASYTLSMEGYLADGKTLVWQASKNGVTGTAIERVELPVILAPTPFFTPEGGSFPAPTDVAIFAAGVQAIEYSTDSLTWKLYESPVRIAATGKLHARALQNGTPGASRSASFTIAKTEVAPQVVLVPDAGRSIGPQQVVLTAKGATKILYALGEVGWNQVLGDSTSLSIETTSTLRVRSIQGADTSSLLERTYTIAPQDPVLTPGSDTSAAPVQVRITAEGADSFQVSGSHGRWPVLVGEGSASFVVTRSDTVKVVAYRAGTPSREATATIVIMPPAKPSFALDSATFGGPRVIGLASSRADTLEVWGDSLARRIIADDSGLVAISSGGRVFAVAILEGARSDTDTATFVIDPAPVPDIVDTSGTYGMPPRVQILAAGADRILVSADRLSWSVYDDADRPEVRHRLFARSLKHGDSSAIDSIQVKVTWDYGIPWSIKIDSMPLYDRRDGKLYRTVTISGTRWMAQNLAYAGPLGGIGRCYGDDTTNCAKYGRLYTWSEAMGISKTFDSTRWAPLSKLEGSTICPTGWYLPTKSQLDSLIGRAAGRRVMTLGSAAENLRSAGDWDQATTKGFDALGFRALPAGRFSPKAIPLRLGGYVMMGVSTGFWSSQQHDTVSTTLAYGLYLEASELTGVLDTESGIAKTFGQSVRCVEYP